MEVQTVWGLALTGVGLVLMAVFRAIEYHQSRRLISLLMEEGRPAWATWPFCIAATLFAPGTALAAAGHLVSRTLAGCGTSSGPRLWRPGPCQPPTVAQGASLAAGDCHGHQASPS